MGGVYKAFIRQAQNFSVQRIVQHAAQVSRGPAEGGAQIGAAHVTDEERVAGEHGGRTRVRCPALSIQIMNENGNGFRGVPWSLERHEAHAAELDSVAIMERPESVIRLCRGPKINGRALAVAQLEVAGHKI